MHLLEGFIGEVLAFEKFVICTKLSMDKKIEKETKKKLENLPLEKFTEILYCVAESLDSTFNFKNGRDSRKWQLSK